MWTSLLAVLLASTSVGGGGGGPKAKKQTSDDISAIKEVTGDEASQLIEENDSLLVLFYDAKANNKLVLKILEKIDTDKESRFAHK